MAERKRELRPLPPGPHEITPEQVAHDQRERLTAALVELVAAQGYGNVSIAEIIKVARVSRRTFYEHYKTKEACFLAAFDNVLAHLHDLVDEATAPIADWPHRVAAGIGTVLRFFVAEPELAHLLVVDSLTAGSTVAARYREGILSFAPLLEPGRDEKEHPRPLPPSTEDTVIGSIASQIARKVSAGETAELEGMLGDLLDFALSPYLEPSQVDRAVAEVESGT